MSKQYRQPSYRLRGYDYRQSGWYYFTICTHGRRSWFGFVEHDRVCVNMPGSIVWNCWLAIPFHHSNAVLDEFIVMPDHVHGVIRIINGNNTPTPDDNFIFSHHVKRNEQSFHSIISPQSNSLSVIIRLFKSATSRLIRASSNPSFQWQRSFHDRIIRNEQELNRIRKYIRDNPKNCQKNSHQDCYL